MLHNRRWLIDGSEGVSYLHNKSCRRFINKRIFARGKNTPIDNNCTSVSILKRYTLHSNDSYYWTNGQALTQSQPSRITYTCFGWITVGICWWYVHRLYARIASARERCPHRKLCGKMFLFYQRNYAFSFAQLLPPREAGSDVIAQCNVIMRKYQQTCTPAPITPSQSKDIRERS